MGSQMGGYVKGSRRVDSRGGWCESDVWMVGVMGG